MSAPRRACSADAPRWPALLPIADHRHSGRAEARRRSDRQRVDHLRAAVRPDADRHADLDLARPHRAHLPVHDDDGADRVGGAEAVHRHREVRDHGDPVLHPRRQLPDARRRRAADDRLRVVDGRPLARRPRRSPASWPARCSPRCPARSPATVVAIGSIILPAMVKQGFPKRFGAGVITTSGALGILIPPSIVMVMYAVATNTSVGQLFIAGIVPGLVLATMLGLTTWWRARKNNYPRQPKATLGRALAHVPREHLGPAADRRRHRRHLHRHLHADRGGRDERGLRVLRRGLRLQGPDARRRCRRCCSTRPT